MILQVLVILLTVVVTLNAFYLFVFSIAGLRKTSEPVKHPEVHGNLRFLVLLPGYAEDAVILQSVVGILKQNYPTNLIRTVVIADSFRAATLHALDQTGATVFKLPPDSKRNKAKAINRYLEYDKGNYDVCLVLDADNVAGEDIFQKACRYFNQGEVVVQARRKGKIPVNRLSRLDELSEIINNHIFRKGQTALGFSGSLIGSGMFIEMNLFRSLMQKMEVFSGFDKELEMRILERKLQICYAEEIEIFDEKVAVQQAYINQKRRWVFAQYYFFRMYASKAMTQFIINGYNDYVNKVVQFSLLPRIICIGLAALLLPVSVLAGTGYLLAALPGVLLLITALYLPVRKEVMPSEIFRLLTGIPSAFAGMVWAFCTSGRASGKFIHTPHIQQ